MELSYRRPAANEEFLSELEIKRSKFLTFIARATTEQEAREFIGELKHRYPDARHHCSAFIVAVEDANAIERSSDDGEPAGTAGTPMLDVLRGSGLFDVVAVTVRYFGGIKLGAGGLVHAYSESVSRCLEQVVSVVRSRRELYWATFSHADAGRIEAELRGRGYLIVGTDYGARVTYTIAVAPGAKPELEATLAALTSGGARVVDAGIDWVE